MAEVPKGKGKRVSTSGTVLVGGVISMEEYNRKLVGLPGLDILDEMRRSDSTTSTALRIVKLPVQSAKWKITPASDDAQDVKVAGVVQHNLDFLGWKQVMKEIMLYLDFGFSIFEKVVDLIESPEYGAYLGISELGSMKQRTVYKWLQQDGTPGITQLDPTGSGGGEISVPMEKLIIFTNDMEGKNYAGRSLLRPAYKHWYMKEGLYKIDALAHEKNGLGIPNLKTPAKATDPDKEAAREVVRNIRANEAAFSEMPEGFELTFLDMMARTVRDPMNSINHHATAIMKSVLAAFLELGSSTSKGGSHSLSKDLSALFMKSEEATADYIKEVMQRKFIPDIVNMNFPTTKVMPTITYSDLQDTDATTLAEAVGILVGAGAVTPEATLEEHLRTIYDLPSLPQEIADDYENRPMPPAKSGVPATPDDTQASLRHAIRGLDNYIEASLNENRKRNKAKG